MKLLRIIKNWFGPMHHSYYTERRKVERVWKRDFLGRPLLVSTIPPGDVKTSTRETFGKDSHLTHRSQPWHWAAITFGVIVNLGILGAILSM